MIDHINQLILSTYKDTPFYVKATVMKQLLELIWIEFWFRPRTMISAGDMVIAFSEQDKELRILVLLV